MKCLEISEFPSEPTLFRKSGKRFKVPKGIVILETGYLLTSHPMDLHVEVYTVYRIHSNIFSTQSYRNHILHV
jgi:hypothetical protein